MPNIRIDNRGMHKLLQGLKPHKATGPDMVPARLLRYFSIEFSVILTMLFQTSLNAGNIPTEWRKASIVPIFKKGDQHKASNYRPVSLTSTTCKLLEHIIHSNIMDHYDRLGILTDTQHWCRSKRSCKTQLIITFQELASSLTSGEQVDVILLDFSKAFDKVPHTRLLKKLHHYVVRGNINHWIQDFLTSTIGYKISQHPEPR